MEYGVVCMPENLSTPCKMDCINQEGFTWNHSKGAPITNNKHVNTCARIFNIQSRNLIQSKFEFLGEF